MEWQDEAIVLGSAQHGETSAVVDVLSASQGRHRGLVRGGRSSRLRGMLQPGTIVRASWRGRLAEHLGTLSCEPIRAVPAAVLSDAARLAAVQAACGIVGTAVPVQQPHPEIFAKLSILLQRLGDVEDWANSYLVWELALLADLGYGLDLARCAATGVTSDLVFVSPRSGRAVSRAAGEPYRDKLLPLPAGLARADLRLTPSDVDQGLALTGFFFEKHVYGGSVGGMPAVRSRLVRLLARRDDAVTQDREEAHVGSPATAPGR